MGEVEGIFFDEMHFSPLFHLGLLWATFSVIGHRAQPMDLKIKVHPVEPTQPTVLGTELGFRAGYRSGYDSEDSDNSAPKSDEYRSGSEQKEDRYGDKDCYQPAVTGLCMAAIRRWFYNHKSGRCEKFTYGGCGGNGNNFQTEESCKRTCGNKKDSSQPEVHKGVDCVWAEWGDWSSCTRACDEGIIWRFRTIKHQKRFGGKQCKASSISDYTETKPCNEQPCNSDESSPKGGNGYGHGYGSKESDEPNSDEQGSDEPESDEEKSYEPESDEPDSDEPESDEPESDEPEYEEPEFNEPESDEPESDEEKSNEKEYERAFRQMIQNSGKAGTGRMSLHQKVGKDMDMDTGYNWHNEWRK